MIETFAIPVYLNASAASLTGASITATAGPAPVGAASNIPDFSSANGTITVAASATSTCLPLTISPTTLSTAERGVPYLQTLGATGVTAWALATGSNPLPTGLSLNPVSGVISGTPTANGLFAFTIQLTGSTSSASQSFTLQVNPPLLITTGSLPATTQASAYNQSLTTEGGLGGLSWIILSGSLPGGLTLNGLTGQINGTATAAGTFSFTVKANDSSGAEATQALSIQVNAAPALCTSTSLPNGSPALVRAEGTTELLAELALSCQGTGGTATFQITTTAGVPITSKVLNGAVTEAALVTTSGTTLGTIDSTGTVITFSGVTVPAGTATLTIANIRVNASVLGAGASPVPVLEVITSTGVPTVTLPAAVGFALTSLASPSISGAGSFAGCGVINAATGPAFTIQAGELFGGFFKVQQSALNSTLGSGYATSTETGFLVSSGGVGNVANSGTRLRIIFKNVPANVSLYVPLSPAVTGTSPGDTDAITLTASETGPFGAVTAVIPTAGNTLPASPALGLVAISGGNGEAVYEVTAANPANIDSYSIPVYIVGTGAVTATGTISATVSFAPIGAPSNIPNFVSFSTPFYVAVTDFCLLSQALPDGQVGKPYGPVTLAASGGTAPYTFVGLALPPGLVMSTGGTVTGTPTQAGGAFSTNVMVTDATGLGADFGLSIQVQGTNPLTITTTSLTPGYQGVPYSQTLQATGGSPPYTWTLSSGSLSGTGLTLNAATGAITGTPGAIATIPLTVRVTDSLGVAVTQNLTLQIVAPSPPAITSAGGLYAPGAAPGGRLRIGARLFSRLEQRDSLADKSEQRHGHSERNTGASFLR